MINPGLYYALKQRFGTVKIANEGEPYRSITKTVDGHDKRYMVEAGEQYKVNCPYCGDTRHRLYISHMYRTLDDCGRVFGKYLAHCFNEKCDTSNLENELKLYVQWATHIIQPEYDPRAAQEMFVPTTLPGRCVDLLKLPSNHPAIQYIVNERKFDPKELQNDWGAVYCESAEEDQDGFIPGTKIYSRLVRNRIIAPIYWQAKLVGWQARALEDHKIKYYTMPGLHKNYMLYNGDRARQHRFGVVVEGFFDAWRVGTRAVALLGKSMSTHQRQLASAYWSTGALCVMLDPDAVEDMDNLQQLIAPNTFRWGSFAVTLPDNNDPADMEREALWQIIIGCARNRGIQLASV
jgi:hypothetical protein